MSTMRLLFVVWVGAAAACHDRGASTAPADGASGTPRGSRTWHDGAPAMLPAGSTIWLDEAGTRPITLPSDLHGGGLVVRVADSDGGERIAVDTETDAACPGVGLFGLRLRLYASASALTEPRTTTCRAAADPKPVEVARVSGGAEVFWRDGTKAGTVPRTRPMYGSMVAAGARTCFPVAFAPRDEVTLCFPVASVQQPEVVVHSPPVEMPSAEAPVVMDAGEFGGALGDGERIAELLDAEGDGLGVIGTMEGTAGLGRADADGLGTAGGTTGLRAAGPSRDGSVQPGKAKVIGKLDRDIVRRIVRAHINQLRFCYRKALDDAPLLAGNTTVAFNIDADGSVIESRVTKSLGNASLDECMAKAIARWKFPKPDGGGRVAVTYPLTLAVED
jgi:TonB family protein